MTNFVQKSFAQFGRPDRNSSDDASGSPQKHLSPKKNPFGGNKIKVSHEPLNRKPSGVVHEQEDEGGPGGGGGGVGGGGIPTRIEDVPFRRQDRRVLNARKKRVTDRKLYKCILITGLLLILIGGALLYVFLAKHTDLKWAQPFVIIGPVLMCCGLAIMIGSIEVIVRLVKNAKRVKDPELDQITNLHHVKHWIDPVLVPFGWGQNPEDNDNEFENRIEVSDRATLKGSLAAINPLAMIQRRRSGVVMAATSVSGTVTRAGTADVSNTTSITSSESKEAILELTASALTTTAAVADATGVTPSSNGGGGALIKSRDDQDIIEMTHFHDKMTNGVVDDEDIPSDIFDESLRYSGVDRPTFTIDKALDSSLDLRRAKEQLRGEFQTEEDRIKSLFATKNDK